MSVLHKHVITFLDRYMRGNEKKKGEIIVKSERVSEREIEREPKNERRERKEQRKRLRNQNRYV